MDFFEHLRRVTGDIPWGTFAQVMAKNLGTPGAAAQSVADQLKEWGSHLTRNALSKWAPAVMAPVPCDSPDFDSRHPEPCRSFAVLRCDACGRPCCLIHARVDYMGDGICEVCIIEAQARGRASFGNYARPHAGEPARGVGQERKPGEMTPEKALKVLKLPTNATWEQIHRQYRKLVVKYNADRPQPEKQRLANVERLKKINAAHEVLRALHEQKRAA